MHPILFEIPGIGFPIRSFGVAVAAGILLGIWLWGKLLERFGDDPREDPLRGSQVALWIVVGVLVGARLMYVVVESSKYLGAEKTEEMTRALSSDRRAEALASIADPQERAELRRISVGYDFLHDPFQIVQIWKGGLVMYGGLFGGILCGLWSARRNGLAIWNGLDTGLLSGFVGLSIGRWGCLLVGDDHGKVVPEGAEDLPFPVTVTVPSLAWLRENPQSLFDHDLAEKTLWATQVWMSVNALLIALVGYLLLKYRKRYGRVAAWMIVHYSITRYVIEMYRGDDVRGLWFGGTLSTSQLVSVLGLALGVAMILKGPGDPIREPELESA